MAKVNLTSRTDMLQVPPLGTSDVTPGIINPASWMYERIVKSIIDFEKDLDQESEIGARLVNFNSNEIISIDDVGYWGPDLVKFYGINSSGQKVELMQHMTQVNVLLVAIPKQHDQPKRIGFLLEEKLNKEED
jgi:Family of unknown function (DUF6173)